MSLNATTPTMIIKSPVDRKQKPNGFSFLVCSDGSKKSLEALNLICRMRQSNDKITVIICEQKNLQASMIKRQIESELELKDCLLNSEVVILPNHGKKPSVIIREHLDEGECDFDFVFVGN